MLKRLTNGELALALLVTSLFWISVLGWATSYAPTDSQKDACYQAAAKSGRSIEECKSFWDKTTSDPVAMFTLVLAVSTVGLWSATIGLYFAGERQLAHAQSESEGVEFYRKVQYEQISEQIAALQQSAEAAEQAARASVDQARASVEQANIARTALTQLERPYIFIFGVHRFQLDAETKEFFIEYTVANYGKMPAIIEISQIGFVVDNQMQPPIPLLVEESHSLITSPILSAGEQRVFREYMPANMTDGGVIVEVAEGQTEDGVGTGRFYPNVTHENFFELFFRGTIQYRGPSSSGHLTSAMWWYYSSRNEFVVRGGEEYNYAK